MVKNFTTLIEQSVAEYQHNTFKYYVQIIIVTIDGICTWYHEYTQWKLKVLKLEIIIVAWTIIHKYVAIV